MWTTPDKRNKDKHCEYHETHSHTTESCLALKYFLERQIKQGNLNQYVPRQLPPPPLEITATKISSTPSSEALNPPLFYRMQSLHHSTRKERGNYFFLRRWLRRNWPKSHGGSGDNSWRGKKWSERILVDNGSSMDICFKHTMGQTQAGWPNIFAMHIENTTKFPHSRIL